MIHIVSVNYFDWQGVDRLSESLRSQTYGNWRLTVVDNSTDVDQYSHLVDLCSRDVRCSALPAPDNIGYIHALTFALSHAKGIEGATWTGLCNTDLEFREPDSLLNLSLMDADAGVGVVAPSILSSHSGRDQNPYFSRKPSALATGIRALLFDYWRVADLFVRGSSFARRALGRRGSSSRSMSKSGMEIYAAHGACFFMSRAYFECGGLPNYPVWLFGEEIFVAEECRKKGLRVYYRPEVRVTHAEHVSTGTRRSRLLLVAQGQAARQTWRMLYGRSQ